MDKEITVYGSKISYFTGKLEGYLRYKEIPYQFRSMTTEYFNRIVPEKTGAQQMPAVEFADGRWATDTTPLIEWFEEQHADSPVVPADPVQAFICYLIEDYADEWLWRPAMHFRWSYLRDRQLLSTCIVDELFQEVKGPVWLKRRMISRRQKSNFVDKDGVTASTREHVQQAYLSVLEILETIFRDRPFIFGERPTLADFGMFGPMFRHFSQDPTPAEIMRETAPAVFEWVARLWNAKSSQLDGELVSELPADILPLLEELGATHLHNLAANAAAWREGASQYEVTVQGTHYQGLPVSRYRVWCLERLQQRFDALPADAKTTLQTLLEQQRCWEPLWRERETVSNYDLDRQAPFAAGLKVYDVAGV